MGDLDYLNELGEPLRTWAVRLSRTAADTGEDLQDLIAGADLDEESRARVDAAFNGGQVPR